MANYSSDIKAKNNIQWDKSDLIVSYSQTYSTLMNACFGIDGSKYVVTVCKK